MTDPLPASTTAKIAARAQSARWQCTLREVRQFRAYCCNINSDGIMGVSKQPVPILRITPNPVCLGSAVDYSFAGSYAPGSTVTAYAIDWGDLTVVDPAPSTGSHVYAAAGTYTVTGTVTEGLGKHQDVEIEINVIDCDAGLLISWTYQASRGGGVYFRDWTDAAPAWAARNTGLAGDALYVNHLAMKPGSRHLPDTAHELWAATRGGLFRTHNGGHYWREVSMPDPSNEPGDVPAPTAADMVYRCVVFSRQTKDLAWILATHRTLSRMYVYRTGNDGDSWSSRGLVI